ncbi:chitobiosyldiphosphodolichol beta-mannosyltransferase [Diaphorina citri]|uniref:Chitobiosyldiphosphodolichol beta-mannosyltransferase n=1 Tax=Diaphorina citri TaxID=121845 RepID=A0A1S3CZY1_DIACI|nr:chitobiosyldiphosphodolichol beta-mannosyltransferase [Diaphorina citri]
MSENSDCDKKKVCIVVLGDIGRSPRMQYHALSLAKEGFSVDLVGYAGSIPIKDLLQSDSVHFPYLQPVPEFKKYMPNMFAFIFKVLFQAVTLFWCLNKNLTSIPSHLLLQNPPAIPTMFICWLYCVLYRVKFIIDWHNYAFTILSLSLNEQHPIVRISKWYERYFGRFSKANLCVTRAMRTDLKENWNVDLNELVHHGENGFVFDTAQQLAHQISLCFSDSSLRQKLGDQVSVFRRQSWHENWKANALPLFTYLLAVYDHDPNSTKPLVVIVTGKGPMKQYYLDEIAFKHWSKITIYTPWLTAEDYPVLIGCADLGVSLHTSSSGLDLPMKVVDMFGCGVPVCAKDFDW